MVVENPHSQWDDEYVVCPYCSEQYGDCWEWVRDYAAEMTCDNCGGVFTHEAEYTATYITHPVRPPPEQTDDEPDPVPAVIIPADEVLAQAIVDVVENTGEAVLVIGETVGEVAGAVAEGVGAAVEGVGEVVGGVFDSIFGQ